MKRTQLLVLCPYPTNHVPAQRFRIEQWEGVLAERGIDCTYAPAADAALMRILFLPGHTLAKITGVVRGWVSQSRKVRRLSKPDAILVCRAASLAGPPRLERALAARGIPIIFDFDDAIFMLNTTEANRWFSWLKFPGKTQALCRLSSRVTAGNNYLADWARIHNPGVTVIPSSVDVRRYPARKPSSARHVLVGWTGSHTSQAYLEAAAPMLERFLAANPRARFRVHSDKPPVLPGVPHEWRPWSAQTEVMEISEFDVGIMPMPDDPWSRGKCSMKALLYMAAGSATVCSASGHNLEVIRHGMNGLLASSVDDWLAALASLVDDDALRGRLGAAGRITVEDRFSREACGAALANVVVDVVGTR